MFYDVTTTKSEYYQLSLGSSYQVRQFSQEEIQSHCHILGQYDFFSILPKWHFKNNVYLNFKKCTVDRKRECFSLKKLLPGFFLSH
jgi:hypothetical protein